MCSYGNNLAFSVFGDFCVMGVKVFFFVCVFTHVCVCAYLGHRWMLSTLLHHSPS